ncbi:MAG: hypothetical protein JNM17_11480 [Archangium sp.]|nr:hypothetical protein [Archangium sp.]
MSAEGKPGRRSLLVVLALAVAAIVTGQLIGPMMAKATEKPPMPMPDASFSSPLPPRPFPPLLAGLEPDGGTLLDTTVKDVDWRQGDSIVIRFERVNVPPTTLEIRMRSETAPAALAASKTLSIYVVSPPDSGTAQRDEELARALGEFLTRVEGEGRQAPQLLPLAP